MTPQSHTTPSSPNEEAIKAQAAVTFRGLGIDEKVLAVLDKANFTTPTPIQHKVIPTAIEGKDIIGIAQTGTGKTLAFGIPMIQRILINKSYGLVVVPTRELAAQVSESLVKVCGPLGFRTATLIGGEPIYKQFRDVKVAPDIIVATPGRLLDHVKQRTVDLTKYNIVVLDEADHMFDIGFAPQIKEIMSKVPKERQSLLFSATMPAEIAKLAMEHMALPLRIEVAPQGTSAERVEQEHIVVSKQAKLSLLVKLLGEHQGAVLVFTRTKHGAKNITHSLRDVGFTSAEIHSNRTLAQRKESLAGFKSGKYRVLVATDIAARGIDVKDLPLVVNFDLPEQTEDYVHRIGRTGRAGMKGKAISFVMPDQHKDVVMIEKLIKKAIPMKSHEGATIIPGSSYRPQRGGGGSRGAFGAGRSSGGRGGFGGSRGGFSGSRGSFSSGARSKFAPVNSRSSDIGGGSYPPARPAGGGYKAYTPRPSSGSSFGARPSSYARSSYQNSQSRIGGAGATSRDGGSSSFKRSPSTRGFPKSSGSSTGGSKFTGGRPGYGGPRRAA